MNNLLTGLLTSEESAYLGIFMVLLIMIIIVAICMYIYTSLVLMAIAKKTKTEPSWLAWIPVANLVLLSKIAKMNWWPVLLIIPAALFLFTGFILMAIGQNLIGIILLILYAVAIILFTIFISIWYWKTFEALNRPGWWILTSIIPAVIYLILYFTKSIVLHLIGSLISLGGTITFLVLLGITAWTDVPTHANITIKSSAKKSILKNKKR